MQFFLGLLLLASFSAHAVDRPDPINGYLPAPSEVLPIILPATGDQCRAGYTCYTPPTSCDFTFTTESTEAAVESALNNTSNGPVFCVPPTTDWSGFSGYVNITRDCTGNRCVIIPSDFASMTTNAKHRTSPKWNMIHIEIPAHNWAIIGQDITSGSGYNGVWVRGDHAYVAHNYIHDYGLMGTGNAAQGIHLTAYGESSVVYSNIIENGCLIPGKDCSGVNGGGADRSIVHRNTIRDWGGGDGIEYTVETAFDAAPDTKILANHFDQTGAYYIDCNSGTTPTGSGECMCSENAIDFKTGNGIVAGNLVNGVRKNRSQCGGSGSADGGNPHGIYADGWTYKQNIVWDSHRFISDGSNQQFRGVGSSLFANVIELASNFTGTDILVSGWVSAMSGTPHQFSWNTVKCTGTTSNQFGSVPYSTSSRAKALTYNLFIGCDEPDWYTPENGSSIFQNAYVDTDVTTDPDGENAPFVDDTVSLPQYTDFVYYPEICEHRADPGSCSTRTIAGIVPPAGGVLDGAVSSPTYPYGSGATPVKKVDGINDNTFGAVVPQIAAPTTESLTLAPRGTYFQTSETSQPVLFFGENVWDITAAMDQADIDTYFAERSTRYNAIHLNALHFSTGACIRQNQYGFYPFQTSGDTYINVTTPTTGAGVNDDWWDHLDYIIDAADTNNMYVFLQPTWGHMVEPRLPCVGAIFDGSNARGYGHWLGSRYANKTNIIWVIGGDTNPTVQTAVWREMASGINEGVAGVGVGAGPDYNQSSAGGVDWTQTLMTFHPQEANAAGAAATVGNDLWIDMHGFQARNIGVNGTTSGEATYGQTEAQYSGAAGPTYRFLPVTILEDNHAIDEGRDDEVRANPYQTILAGGVSYFGARSQVFESDGTPAFNAEPGWTTHVTYTYEQVAKSFFESFAWWNLIPDQTLITSGAGTVDTEAYKIAAIASDASRLYVFYGENSAGTIDVSRVTSGSPTQWDYIFMNPDSGLYDGSGTTSGPTQALTPPAGWEQAVLIVSPSAGGVDRPQSPEEAIFTQLRWPSEVLHGRYQPKHEFPFYDSRVDTCDDTGTAGTDAWPYDPELIPATSPDPAGGLDGCFDIVPPSWEPVSCTGASGVHPSLANVYIVRNQDRAAGYAAADSATYKWVLACPGSLDAAVTVTAAGTGLNPGEARVYDCLDSTGGYTPMRPFSRRTGTVDECHLRRMDIRAKYVFLRNHYFEAVGGTETQGAIEVQDAASGWNVIDNVDVYGGGQTGAAVGYPSAWLVRLESSDHGWLQNFRLVDCMSRSGFDSYGIDIHGFFPFARIINGEITNCAGAVVMGSNSDNTNWTHEGAQIENIWASMTPAKYMNQIDPRYWWGAFGQDTGTKIPYGYSTGGQPPSYVKAPAVTEANLDAAFKCAADKTSSACPYMCDITGSIFTRSGAQPGDTPVGVRRVHSWGGRPSQRDANNPIEQEGSPPGQKFAQCGGFAGAESGSGELAGRWFFHGVEADLFVGEGIGPLVRGYSSSFSNKAVGVKVKNSLNYKRLESYLQDQYLDELANQVLVRNQEVPTLAGWDEGIDIWGSTFISELESWGTDGAWSDSTVAVTGNCNNYVDAHNSDVSGGLFSGVQGGLYGSSLPHNGLTQRFPTTGTYATSSLGQYCYITNPWTAIGAQSVTYRCIPLAVPADQSPVIAQCSTASPF